MGSEMCIRDSGSRDLAVAHRRGRPPGPGAKDRAARALDRGGRTAGERCLLYTSDAADERSSVDLGGGRII